jgi:hypothetical protein
MSTAVGQVLIDLIASFVSANGAGVSFGFRLSNKLLETGKLHCDPGTGRVICCSEDELVAVITAEPYPRGDYVARLVANRIHRAIEQINAEGGALFLERLKDSDFRGASSMLLPLYGVGPRFVENYCLLAGIEKR